MVRHTFYLPFSFCLRKVWAVVSIPIFIIGFVVVAAPGRDGGGSSPMAWLIATILAPGGAVLLVASLYCFYNMAFALVVTEEAIGCYTWYGARNYIPWDAIISVREHEYKGRGRIRETDALTAVITYGPGSRKCYLNIRAIPRSADLTLLVRNYAGISNPLARYLERHTSAADLYRI